MSPGERLPGCYSSFGRTSSDYVVEFHTLAAEGTWNMETLFNMFLHRLSEKAKDELTAQELPTDLDSLIALTIRIDGRLREG
jgi:hypothetical protein